LTAISMSLLDGLAALAAMSNFVGSFGWPVVFALFTWLTLVFPSGHLLSGTSFWSRAGHFYGKWGLPALLFGLGVISLTAGPGRVDASRSELEADFGPGSAWIVGWSLLVAFQLASGISLFVRRRHAVGVERAQLGWVVLPLVLFGGAVATTAAYVVWSVATGRPDPGDAVWTPVYVILLLFPLTFGIAILRYRLYSIDRIISRTLSYGLITAMLLGIYLGAIFVLGAILPEQGDLAVAGSTLVAAALANPLRTHVQRWVDRRFNRARFNAELTLEALTRRLATEVDLSALSRELVSVVGQTLQPVTSRIWLRETAS
ncbi:MAG: hypothetical protein ABR609_15835, partial [Acidimicrobiia bacterium]